jgi:hypothetical protein
MARVGQGMGDADAQAAAGDDDAAELQHDGRKVVHVHQGVVGHGEIDRCRSKRKGGAIGDRVDGAARRAGRQADQHLRNIETRHPVPSRHEIA